MSFVDTFFNNYSGGGNTSGSTQYANRVYFGVSQPKEVRMKRSGQTISVPGGDETLSIADAKKMYLTDEELRNKWGKTLANNGITANPIQARALWELSVDGASDWYSTSNGQQKVTPEQYITWYSGGKKKADNVPTRQIYNIRPEQIDSDVNDIALKSLGRELTDADREAKWYKDLLKSVQNMYRAGTVSSPSRLEKNKQTGKMERISEQSPEFSKVGVTNAITKAVEEADPISLERKQNLDLANWAFKKMGGGQNG